METIKIGRPVKPMLVSESGNGTERYQEIIERHGGTTLSELKSDGYRIQVHKGLDSGVGLFTRTLNALDPAVFPEIADSLKDLPKGVYDGELVGVQDGIAGFNAVKKRVRGNLDSKLVSEFPLQVKFFDVLRLEDEVLIDMPLHGRRQVLENYVENVSRQDQILGADELEEVYSEIVGQGMEGLVCKDPTSKYLVGKRTKDWIKLKNFLSLDLTILGVYDGQGKAAELPFAALLLGTKNNKGLYETVTKVGISNRDFISQINRKIGDRYIDSPPSNVLLSDRLGMKTYARKVPTNYVRPEDSVVVEVEALNVTRAKNWHSCGAGDGRAYSLRIPIVRGVRDDKAIDDCTTTKQIGELYDAN